MVIWKIIGANVCRPFRNIAYMKGNVLQVKSQHTVKRNAHIAVWLLFSCARFALIDWITSFIKRFVSIKIHSKCHFSSLGPTEKYKINQNPFHKMHKTHSLQNTDQALGFRHITQSCLLLIATGRTSFPICDCLRSIYSILEHNVHKNWIKRNFYSSDGNNLMALHFGHVKNQLVVMCIQLLHMLIWYVCICLEEKYNEKR